jgi:hypothetical protein
MTNPPQEISPSDLERLFSAERLSTYLAHCEGNFAAAVEMYRWNSAITAAFWEPIGHLEVALRNTLDDRLAARHRRFGRPGSWPSECSRRDADYAHGASSAARRERRIGRPAVFGLELVGELP